MIKEFKRMKLVLDYNEQTKKYLHLINLCIEFEMLCRHIERLMPYVTDYRIGNLLVLIHRITQEYVKLLRNMGYDKEKVIDEVMKDIRKTYMSSLYTEKGEMIDITPSFAVTTNEPEKIVKRMKVSYKIIAPLRGFIQSKIYDSLREAINLSFNNFDLSFYNSTTGKVGTLPQKMKDTSIEILTEKKKKDEEEKD